MGTCVDTGVLASRPCVGVDAAADAPAVDTKFSGRGVDGGGSTGLPSGAAGGSPRSIGVVGGAAAISGELAGVGVTAIGASMVGFAGERSTWNITDTTIANVGTASVAPRRADDHRRLPCTRSTPVGAAEISTRVRRSPASIAAVRTKRQRRPRVPRSRAWTITSRRGQAPAEGSRSAPYAAPKAAAWPGDTSGRNASSNARSPALGGGGIGSVRCGSSIDRARWRSVEGDAGLGSASVEVGAGVSALDANGSAMTPSPFTWAAVIRRANG